MITRRTFGAGAVAAGLMGFGCSCARGATAMGCHMVAPDPASARNDGSGETIDPNDPRHHRRRSGDPDLDFALAQTLAKLSDTFNVVPGFLFYDDRDSANAMATTVVLAGRSDGTVLLGLRLLRKFLRSSEAPAVAIATVCAHEFAHILQFKRGLMRRVNAGQRNVRRSELQADYLAGYFTGLRKLERASYAAAEAALTQRDHGDEAFYDPGHHGTPEERGAAVAAGFRASFRQGLSLEQAVEESTRYVLDL